MMAPKSLSLLSNKIGKNLDLVQGAGGNTSFKDNEILWVKASGFWLSEADKKNIFVPVRYKEIIKRLNNNELDPISPEVIDFEGSKLKPSIETSLHALMPHKYVVHTHSVNALANIVLNDGHFKISRFLEGLKWEWVKYVRPGLPLTLEVQKAIQSNPDIIILANHGVVFGANSLKKINALIYDFEKRINTIKRKVKIQVEPLVIESFDMFSEYKFVNHPLVQSLAFDDKSISIISSGSLYPDHVVFLGAGPICVLTIVEFKEFVEKFNTTTNANIIKVIVVKKLGVFLQSSLKNGSEEMLHCLANVLLRVGNIKNLRFLTLDEESELLGWDAEKYRQNINLSV